MKVKVGLSRLSMADVIAKSLHILSHLENNPHFPYLPYSTEEIHGQLQLLMECEHKRSISNFRIRPVRDEVLRTLMHYMYCCAQYVNLAAKGDVDKLLTSGFELRSVPRPLALPPKIPSIGVINLGTSGSVKVFWQGVRNSKYFKLECNHIDPQDSNSWKGIVSSTETRVILNHLPIGQYTYFRVSAVNGKGRGEWSNVARVMVV